MQYISYIYIHISILFNNNSIKVNQRDIDKDNIEIPKI